MTRESLKNRGHGSTRFDMKRLPSITLERHAKKSRSVRRIVVVTKGAPKGRIVGEGPPPTECPYLPGEMWVNILQASSVLDVLAVTRTCTSVRASIYATTENPLAELLARIKSFVRRWTNLSRDDKGKIYAPALDYFWTDHFEDAGRLGCTRWMSWLPNPMSFNSYHDASVCSKALNASHFEFLDWAITRGYRMYFAYEYQKLHYQLIDKKVSPKGVQIHVRILAWLTANRGKYNLDGGLRRTRLNPLNPELRFVLFYPVCSAQVHVAIRSEPKRPYWKL